MHHRDTMAQAGMQLRGYYWHPMLFNMLDSMVKSLPQCSSPPLLVNVGDSINSSMAEDGRMNSRGSIDY